MKSTYLLVVTALVVLHAVAIVPIASAEDEKPLFVTESYYTVQWGHFDEFMELFKRNHYPILAELKKTALH